MRTLLLYVLIACGVALTSWSLAGADPTTGPAILSTAAATAPTLPPLPGDAAPAATAEPTPAELEAQNAELKESLSKLKAAWDDLRNGAGAGKLLLWMLLVAAACNVLLNLLKVISPYIGDRAKIVKWIALGLGVVAGFTAAYAGGQTLLTSLVVFGLGPVLAIAVHELGSPILDRLLGVIRPA